MGLHGESDSREFARWQGAVDTRLGEHLRRLDNINGDVREIKNSQNAMEKDLRQGLGTLEISYAAKMANLQARVAMFSAIGGLVGAGAVSLVVAILTR